MRLALTNLRRRLDLHIDAPIGEALPIPEIDLQRLPERLCLRSRGVISPLPRRQLLRDRLFAQVDAVHQIINVRTGWTFTAADKRRDEIEKAKAQEIVWIMDELLQCGDIQHEEQGREKLKYLVPESVSPFALSRVRWQYGRGWLASHQ